MQVVSTHWNYMNVTKTKTVQRESERTAAAMKELSDDGPR